MKTQSTLLSFLENNGKTTSHPDIGTSSPKMGILGLDKIYKTR